MISTASRESRTSTSSRNGPDQTNLTIVEVHKPADLPLHISLVAGVLECPAQVHHLQSLQLILLRNHVVLRLCPRINAEILH